MRTESSSHLTLTMCSNIYCLSHALKVTRYNTFQISHHTPPFSSHQVICDPLASTSPFLVHRHHWHAVSSCRLLLSLSPSQTERNSLWVFFPLFFFLFFKQCSEAVVMVMGYKDSSSSQCAWVGRALRLGLWMCVKECGCVSCIIPRIMPWRGWRDDLLVISWIWCVFYCLLNRVLIKRLGNDLFALVKVLINPLYSSSSFCCLSVTHTEGCTHWFSQSSWHADTKYSQYSENNKKGDNLPSVRFKHQSSLTKHNMHHIWGH